MTTERVERRLAAILSADVVGYGRLMGADVEGTLARAKTHREELIDIEIADHCGRYPASSFIEAGTPEGIRSGESSIHDLTIARKTSSS
jgi:class 3 adenylate cyclase